MKKYIYAILLLAVSTTSCNIDRMPHGQMPAERIIDDPKSVIDNLVNGVYAQLKTWSDPMHRCGEYAGDNIMIRGASTDAFYEFITFNRTPQNYRLQSFWDSSYKAIAQASNIIKMIPEGDDAYLNNKLGECYYIRGLMYFYLCRVYGRPYFQAPDKNLGVPIVNGTPNNIIGDLRLSNRATVKETYDQIISDLKKAETLLTETNGTSYASKAAAEALLSRVYLYMSGTYEQPNVENAKLTIEYATKVIDSGDFSLLSRNEYMKSNRLNPDNNPEIIFAIKRLASEYSGYDYYYTVGGMYSNIDGMGWGEMYASAKYLDLLNETGRNDWREKNYKIVDARAAFIEPQYDEKGHQGDYFRFIYQEANVKQHNELISNYNQFKIESNGNQYGCIQLKDDQKTFYPLTAVDKSAGIYTINYKGHEYKGYIDHYIKLNRAYPMFYITKSSLQENISQLHSPIISGLDEIYLNRAEAYAKIGNYDKARLDLNKIRERALPNGGYATLNASNAATLIDKERQLELAFQAERSFDVFRNGGDLVRKYPGPHNQNEIIKATDYRVVFYIPQDAINAYPGELTQNPTDQASVITQ